MSDQSFSSEPQFLTVTQVAKRYAVSTATIWRWGRADAFPPPVGIGTKSTRWRISDVERHDSELVACFVCALPRGFTMDEAA